LDIKESGAQAKTSPFKMPISSSLCQRLGFADSLPVGVFTCDKAGKLVEFNQRCVVLWGAEPPAEERHKFSGAHKAFNSDGELVDPSDMPVAEVLRTGKPVSERELTFERPDGSRVPVEVSAEPIFEAGKLAGVVACIQDITKRQEAECRLQQEQERLAPYSIAGLAIRNTDSAKF
jgi:PAS domain-containing protein